ncbi:hypothetical protein OQA88_7386 [Cercophora sp. LCS_1]
MSTKQAKRTVLITGTSDGGLGSALAIAFHNAGWRVIASARNTSKLTALAPLNIETVQLDTLSDTSITTAVQAVRELTGGSLDALVNNAGGGYNMPLMDLDVSKAKALFDLNVWAVIAVTKAFLPLLMKSTHPYGAMVANNTSLSSLTASTIPFSGTYNASKAAVSSITEAMRLELGVLGIRVVNLMTGSVASKFADNLAGTPKLPADSLYGFAKKEVEQMLSGEGFAGGSQQEEWAAGVVAQLGKKNPSHWVWSGEFATMTRLGNHLPVGMLDGEIKKATGFGKVERKIKEIGGPAVIAGKFE